MITCIHIFGINNNKTKFRHSMVIFAKGRPFPGSGTYIQVTGLPQAPREYGGRSACVWRAPLTLCSCWAPLRLRSTSYQMSPQGPLKVDLSFKRKTVWLRKNNNMTCSLEIFIRLHVIVSRLFGMTETATK